MIWAIADAPPGLVVVGRRVDAEAPAFRVTRLSHAGDTRFDRRVPYDPVPIDPALPDSLVEAWARWFHDNGRPGMPDARQAAEWARANLYFPAHRPAVTRVVAGRDGTAWLRREGHDPERVEWLVLDPDGAHVGRLHLPPPVNVLAAERDRFWGTALDELDVPYIVRYSVGADDPG